MSQQDTGFSTIVLGAGGGKQELTSVNHATPVGGLPLELHPK